MSLWSAVGNNDWKAFMRVMDDAILYPLDPSDIYRAMDCAAKKNTTVYMEKLAPLATEPDMLDAYQVAASWGSAGCVQILRPYIHSQSDHEAAFNMCANTSLLVGGLSHFPTDCDHAACLELLTPHVEQKSVNDVLGLIAGQCSVEVLRVLLQYADPKFNNSKALQKAVLNNAQSNLDILYPLSDPHLALQALQKDPFNTPQEWMPLYERIESERIRHTLNTELGADTQFARIHKI